MNQNGNASNRLKLKDIVTLSIFNVAILVVMIIVKMAITMLATPAINYLFYVGIMALLCAPLYIVMSNKVAKHGVFLITSIFCGLMMTAFGSAWFFIVIVVTGIICELIMMGENSYKQNLRNGIAYTVYWTLYALGSAIPLFFFKEQYLKSLEGVYTDQQKEILIRYYGSVDMLVLIAIITAVLSILGFWIGTKFFKKHIKKAKLV